MTDGPGQTNAGPAASSKSGRRPWTRARLDRLFERYADRYWTHRRRLRRYSASLADLSNEHAYGLCDYDKLTIFIDVAAHQHDLAVRHTLLHEMIHAAVGRGTLHGPKFFAEMERLLEAGAPVGGPR